MPEGAELLELARSLRRRLEQAGEGEWPLPGLRPQAGERLRELAAAIQACRRCPLGSCRLTAVPGAGSPRARVMFVGEGPGYEEDHRGEPFVGKAGQLLERILASIGLSREGVYITNVVKCHPMRDPRSPEARGNDRPPSPEEIAACRPYLEQQIRLIGPRVIVTLGSVAARALLGEEVSITKARGQWRRWRLPEGGQPFDLLPTYHPAALLRRPELKRDMWTDMKSLKKFLEARADEDR